MFMDYSQFQLELKNRTHEAHKKAENHPLMQSFIKGEYKKEHLLQFLVNMYPIYSVVEKRLLQERINQVSDLKRSELIEKDINTLITEIVNIKNANILTPLVATTAWVNNCLAKPVSLLKAELYSRWLADFYGGRMLAKTVSPNLMYTSESPKQVIEAVREILDEPNDSSEITNVNIIQEVISFFDFHVEIFDIIYNGSTQTN
jgi:heme oxygenase